MNHPGLKERQTALQNQADERQSVETFLADPSDESFRDLYYSVSPRVYGYFRLRGCEHTLAEDLTQEVMLAVCTGGRRLRNRDLFRPWVLRIARNAWLQHLRSEHRQVPVSGLDAAAEKFCETEEQTMRSCCLGEWLAWLGHEQRKLVVLRYVEGFEYHEIASLLKMPQGTVQWKIFQLKRKLVDYFGAEPV
jgi:RNA polymerase sigma-70 factor (ECF subfamily)